MSSLPTQLSLAEAESQRVHDRAIERTSREPPNLTEESVNRSDRALLATVANAEILTGTITISPDYLCPLSQMIPEVPVMLGNTLFERSFAERYIRDSLTRRFGRGPRCVTDPLNPSRIIYSCEDRSAIVDQGKIMSIVESLLHDVDSQWYDKLRSEVDRARTAPRSIVRTTDGKLIVISPPRIINERLIYFFIFQCNRRGWWSEYCGVL